MFEFARRIRRALSPHLAEIAAPRPNGRLLCVAGPEAGGRFVLGADPAVLGRDVDATIRLQGRDVSRQHVRIRRDGDDVVLEDLGSRNGTLVNGRPASRHALRRGDQIQIGPHHLIYVPA